jgi:hypothetical protein
VGSETKIRYARSADAARSALSRTASFSLSISVLLLALGFEPKRLERGVPKLGQVGPQGLDRLSEVVR